ncbi:MAG: hypothetical protein KDC92_17260, partial [Bacteroidetes bacterium]|nr:hypothetical protein [Bacteroidota bacterium]
MLKKPSIKVFIALASLALLAVTIQFYFIPTYYFQTEQPKNIGYYEQYMAMKADEDGKIPTGRHAKWYAADQAKPAYKKNQTGIRRLQFIGPDNIGGRTRDLVIDASNTNRLLATSVSGGLWESTDAGKSWEPHNDFSVNLNITCIDQSPFNHKVFYYGTGEVIGSSDAPGEGIFKSTDGGVTFSQIQASLDLEFSKIWDLKHSISADSVFYVSVNTKGLYRSTNHGKSFQLVFPTTQHIHDIEVFPNGSVMFARQSRGVFFSETGDSNSFTQLTNGLPSKGFYRIEISTSPKFPKVVFAHYTNGVNSTSGTSEGVYKSSNAGKTWKLVGNPTGNGSFLQPYYTLGFEMSPHDTNFLVAGCTYPFYSTDGGKNWRRGRNSHA